MSYTVQDLKNDMERKLHGRSLAKVTGIDNLIDEAARNVVDNIDPYETQRVVLLDTPLYDDVYDYTAPSDLKGDRIIDVRPQANRDVSEKPQHKYQQEFDAYKRHADEWFTIEFRGGTPILRFRKQLTEANVLHQMDTISDNGTWTVGDDATNLTVDTLFKVAGNASLNIDFDGSTTSAYIENTGIESIDLSNEENIASLFARVYLPNASAITNVSLRWGSDSSNYWSQTVTQSHVGTSFQNGWNRLRFDWNGATKSGSPDSSAITYLRVSFTYDGTADTDIRVDDITAQNGELAEIIYYSAYLFRSSSGTFLETFTSSTDMINLGRDSYNVLLYEALHLAAQQIQGTDSSFDADFFDEAKNAAYTRYTQKYPSQVEKKTGTYYRIRQHARRRGRSSEGLPRASNEGY